MPRIPPHLLDCSFYAYRSLADAKKARAAGGSGFLAMVPLENHEPYVQVYAVTNKHVIDGGGHVLRVNKRDGSYDAIQTQPESWFHHPDGDDVVVLPLDMDPSHKWLAVNIADFVTEEMVQRNEIGVGDEVFMVGRLADREGIEQNNPVVRFGHISMIRDTLRRDYDGEGQESFLVECRSISGFSGSPVFVQPNPEAVAHFGSLQLVMIVPPSAFKGIHLLGIDWCHVPLWKNVYGSEHGPATGLRVDQVTGIAGVVPAWRLAQILNSKALANQRRAEEEKLDR